MKPEDHKTGLDSMLRQGLGSDAPRDAKDCPGADVLAAYYERSLAADEVAQFDMHLATCSRCRAQIAVLVGSETPAQKSTERPAFWVFDWRWLAPTVAALAIVALWVGIRERPSLSNPPVMVATNRNEPAAPAPAPESPPPMGTIESVPRKKGGPTIAPKPAAAPSAGGAAIASSKRRLAMESKVATPQPSKTADTDKLAKLQDASSGAPSGGISASAPAAPQGTQQSAEERTSDALTETAQSTNAGATGASAISSKEATSTSSEVASKSANHKFANRAAAPAHSAPAMGGIIGGLLQTTPGAAKGIVITTPEASKSWRIADSGAIEFSNDAGLTWVTQYSPSPGSAVSGYAPSANVCWIVGHAGLVLRTGNGSDWRQVAVPTPDLTAVHAQDAKHATVTAADGTHYVTKNGGKSWTPQNNP
jgi:hypothetical protein